MNNQRQIHLTGVLTGMLLLVPSVAMANNGLKALDGLIYVLAGLLIYAILFVVNMVLFTTNLQKRSKGRATAVTIFSALIVAASVFVFVSLVSEHDRDTSGIIFVSAAMAIVHIAMIIASGKMIKELSTKENE